MREFNLGKVLLITFIELVVVGAMLFGIGFCSGRDYEQVHPSEVKIEVIE